MDQSEPGPAGIDEWLDGMAEFARSDVAGRIDDLFVAAENGELEDSGDERTAIKPIHRDPELYELRLTQHTKKLRFYHGEPSTLPSALVAVHEHIKQSDKEQEREIRFAASRFLRGRPSSWQ